MVKDSNKKPTIREEVEEIYENYEEITYAMPLFKGWTLTF